MDQCELARSLPMIQISGNNSQKSRCMQDVKTEQASAKHGNECASNAYLFHFVLLTRLTGYSQMLAYIEISRHHAL